MATATNSKSARSSNGTAVAKAKDAGAAVTTVARSARGPALAAGAAAAGLVGGIALGSHLGTRRKGLSGLVARRPKVLGVPLGRKSGLQRTVETLGKAAQELGSATRQVSSTTDEIRQVREQLDQANRRAVDGSRSADRAQPAQRGDASADAPWRSVFWTAIGGPATQLSPLGGVDHRHHPQPASARPGRRPRPRPATRSQAGK